MSRLWLLAGLGGFLGSASRFGIASFLSNRFSSSFPSGTFAVNIIGCLLIGLIYGFSLRFEQISPEWRVFLATGFCGGFTTFSSFAYENVGLLQTNELLQFWLYIFLSLIIGFSAAFAGLLITKLF